MNNKCSLLLAIRNLWVNTKDMQALTIVEPTRDNLIFSPLAELSWDNPLYIYHKKIIILYFRLIRLQSINHIWVPWLIFQIPVWSITVHLGWERCLDAIVCESSRTHPHSSTSKTRAKGSYSWKGHDFWKVH